MTGRKKREDANETWCGWSGGGRAEEGVRGSKRKEGEAMDVGVRRVRRREGADG